MFSQFDIINLFEITFEMLKFSYHIIQLAKRVYCRINMAILLKYRVVTTQYFAMTFLKTPMTEYMYTEI